MTDFRASLQTTLGSNYTIERELGGGGMSRVFVADEAQLGRKVVVKVLPPEMAAGVSADRFLREIRLAASLQHANIVPVLTAGEMDGLPYYTMPFVEGESLRARLARGPLGIAEVVSILRDVARALAYAHVRGIVHRDIKPDNVLLSGGAAVVTDFGIAKAISAARADAREHGTLGALTQVGTSIGTPMYMAPEQAAGDPSTDARADLYSLGCMAYELLTGAPPFAGGSPQKLLAAHMAERPRPVAELRADTPPALAAIVMACLEKDAGQRPQNATEVVALLDQAATTGSGTAASAPAVLLGGRVRLTMALGVWAFATFAAWVLAKAAVVGIGLPTWVVPGAMIVMLLGLPVILFTAYVQRVAHRALVQTPTLTPGGTPVPQGTMATLALKATPHVTWKRTTRGGVIAFGTFAVLVAAFMVLRATGVGPFGSLLASGRLAEREPILVAEFAVNGGADSALAPVVTEAMRAALAQSTAITLVTPQAIVAALQRMEQPPTARLDAALAAQVAQREGIKAIVTGDVTAAGGGFFVSARLVTPDSGAELASFRKAVNGPAELIAAVDEIGRGLRAKVGESLRAVNGAPRLDQVTTASLDALRLYTEGARAIDATGNYTLAVSRLRDAVALDPEFAMAWRKLAAAYQNLGYPREVQDSATTRAYLLRHRLSDDERDLAIAYHFASGTGRDRVRAMEAYERLLERRGDVAANNYAIQLGTRREFARADSVLSGAMRRNQLLQYYINLGVTRAAAGNTDAALATLEEARRRFPAPGAQLRLAYFIAAVEYSRGNGERLEQTLDSIQRAGAGPMRAIALQRLSDYYFARGRPGAAYGSLRTARALEAAAGVVRNPLEDSLQASMWDAVAGNAPARAVARLDAALRAHPFSQGSEASRPYIGVASAYALAGRPDRARAVLAQREAELRDTALVRSERTLVRVAHGYIALAEGRATDAIRDYWASDSLPDGPRDRCASCTYVLVAGAYDRAGFADSAIVELERYFAGTEVERLFVDAFYSGPAAFRLAELYEQRGDRARAAAYYQRFAEWWKDADREYQPRVAEARRRAARLSDPERR